MGNAHGGAHRGGGLIRGGSDKSTTPQPDAPPPPKATPMAFNKAAKESGHAYTIDFINVHTKHFTSRIELMQGKVESLSKTDATDLLVVYLRARGDHKANRDSALAALNRSGISLVDLEKDTNPNPSYRRHYHCWLSNSLPKPRPTGFEYDKLLVYEDPGGELETDDNIALDMMQCLATVIGGEIQVQSVMLPLMGGLLSQSLRKHFIRASVEITYAWIMMGLPIRKIRILLPPDTDVSKDLETFRKLKERVKATELPSEKKYDIYLSYANEDKAEADALVQFIQRTKPKISVFLGANKDVKMRERGIVSVPTISAIRQSGMAIALLSDDYFRSKECTEAFSLAYCSDFDSQGNTLLPVFWRSCDLTPLARRLIATQGFDCREQDMEKAQALLEKLLQEMTLVADSQPSDQQTDSKLMPAQNKVGEKIMMDKENQDQNLVFGDLIEEKIDAAAVDVGLLNVFSQEWLSTFSVDLGSVIFGPKIGAGGFGEVFKAKHNDQIVAVKTLTSKGNEEKMAVLMKEFLLEIKLMSNLKHPNVVGFIGACVTGPQLAILLEFMPGGSLYRVLYKQMKSHGCPLSTVKQIYIAYGIAKGMEYLHAQTPVVVHRDLKSPNVLLGRTVEDVKVTDFGLSRLKEHSYVDTGPGGTPEWMAPEMLRQDLFDESVDVWAFGVILWELMVCEKPFKDDHPMQVVFKVGSKGETLHLPSNVQAPLEMKKLMEACFRHQPERRPKFREISPILEKLRSQYMPQ